MKALNDTESQRASNCLDNNLQPNPVGSGQEKSLFRANSSHKAPAFTNLLSLALQASRIRQCLAGRGTLIL